jgi:tetratricopeptide (TPR) repeat protein
MPPTVDGSPDESVPTLFAQAVALRKAGRWRDAADGFDGVLGRLAGDLDDQPEIARSALYLKIVCLHEDGDVAQVLEACDAMADRYGADTDHKTIGFVADVLWLKSRALARAGDSGRERAVLMQLIEGYADQPPARSQVARAMYNEGIHRRDTQHGEQAIEIWDQLWEHFGSEPPQSDPFIPIRGQLAKSQYLAETGRLDAALATCDRMLEDCRRLQLPDARLAEVRRTAHQCLATARRADGLRGRLRTLLRPR